MLLVAVPVPVPILKLVGRELLFNKKCGKANRLDAGFKRRSGIRNIRRISLIIRVYVMALPPRSLPAWQPVHYPARPPTVSIAGEQEHIVS